MLRRAESLVAPIKPTFRKERLVSPRELRSFLGEPKGSRWAALLKLAGVELKWRAKGKGWRERCGLTRTQCLAVMRVRYAAVGEQRIRRWKLG